MATEVPTLPALDPPRPSRRPRRSPGVFISYRREDASGFAGRLHEALTERFGVGRVFRDVDGIEPGADFGEVIQGSLGTCGAFVAVIGREWFVDTAGRRRLDDPTDWVRLEVEAALERPEVTVIPVLVEGVGVPAAEDLPPSLHRLTRLNAIELSDSRWAYDVDRLVTRLAAVIGPPGPRWRTAARGLLVPKGAPGALGRLALVAALLLGAGEGGRRLLDRPGATARMTGNFNIAVAGFGAVDPSGKAVASPAADTLARTVFDRLKAELASLTREGYELDVRAPKATGPLRGATPARRAAAARDLATRIGADVVVYGTVDLGDPSAFRPEFFVSEAKLPGAEELSGQHQLGSIVPAAGDIAVNPVVQRDVRDQVLGRTRALAELIIGLSYQTLGQAKPALDHLEAARTAPGWDQRDGKEVLYLVLGNAAARTGDLGRADEAYGEALALQPEYARARLGQAEVLFQRSHADCQPTTVDADGLRRSLEAFRSALDAKVQPALSDIAVKADLGQGRVHLCLSQALVADHLADAERELQAVVDAYRHGNHRVRELAAEAYANLGVVHLPAAGDPGAADRYRRAADDYAQALGLTRDTDRSRKALFLSMRGFILSRLGDRAQADDAYRQAISLEQDPGTRAGYERDRAAAVSPP